MGEFSMTFIEAVLASVAAVMVAGLVSTLKLLFGIKGKIDTLIPIVNASSKAMRFLVQANRYQNLSLKGLGANGTTEKSNLCLDDADHVLNEPLMMKEQAV